MKNKAADQTEHLDTVRKDYLKVKHTLRKGNVKHGFCDFNHF